MPSLGEIRIRTNLIPGDLGYLIYLHGTCYGKEHGYGIEFEMYVAEGFSEFFRQYDGMRDCVWLCEHNNKIVGSLVLMHRPNDTAQLRYFLLEPPYRGSGIGKELMRLGMEFMDLKGYKTSYLWTTSDLSTAASLYKRHGYALTQEKETTSFGKKVIEQRYDLVR